MALVLGIDLGTTNSVVCVSEHENLRVLPDQDGNQLIPSVVSFHPAGDVLVGHAARERRLLDARNTVYSIKRLIGRPYRSPEVRRAQERFPFELCEGPTQGVLVRARGETYTLPEISAFVLREVRRIAEERMAESCTQAVITVPANFNELQRSATKAAGRVAGLDVLRILNEPTAAALAYGYGRGSRERIAIFDLGGGTFDITILELAGDVFEVLSTAGDTFLGGDDIDVLIAEKMADAFLQHHRFDPRADPQAYERLRAAAEWAKCQLSSEPEVQLRVEELAYGEGGASLDLSFGMARAALEKLTQPLIARAFDVCEDAMGVAGIRPTQLDNVILVGGSTRMPMVKRMVAEYFGRQPLTNIDPDLVVAQGAALQAAALAPDALDAAGPRRLAKVALKKVSRADIKAISERREALKKEGAEKRPVGPAFQPPKPTVPMWDNVDDIATQIASSGEKTAVGATLDAETRVVASFVDEGRPRRNTLPYDPRVEAPTASGGKAYDEVVRESVPPEEPATTAGQRGRVASGSNPLDFGSVDVPVPSFDEVEPTSPVTPYQPRAAAAVAAPPIPVGRLPGDLAPPPPPPPSAWESVAPAQPPPPPQFAQQPPLPQPPPPQPFAPQPPPPQPPPPQPPPPQPPPPQPPPPQPPPPQPPQRALPAGILATPSFPAPQMKVSHAPPLLLDVTPHTLGIETVGGYCEGVIQRNAAIPVEQTRIFVTAADGQDAVSVRIYQGESRRLDENQALGEIQLTGLRQAPRGVVKIEVTFLMDSDGTLGVRAIDTETGRQQRVRIALVGGVGEDEIQRLQQRQARIMGG